MADNDELFCKIHVDTERTAEGLCASVAGVLNCEPEPENRIHCKWGEITVLEHEDADAEADRDEPESYVHYPLRIEVEPHGTTKRQTYVNGIAVILRHLWAHGWRAVADCDFDAELPHNAGLGYDPISGFDI